MPTFLVSTRTLQGDHGCNVNQFTLFGQVLMLAPTEFTCLVCSHE